MRLRRFVFWHESFVRLFTQPESHPFMWIVKNPLPLDARIVRMYDDREGRLVLVVESAEFDELRDGDPIPELLPPCFVRTGPTEPLRVI
jgi:hypothetical protein